MWLRFLRPGWCGFCSGTSAYLALILGLHINIDGLASSGQELIHDTAMEIISPILTSEIRNAFTNSCIQQHSFDWEEYYMLH